MKVKPLKIPDVKLIEPDVFEDERGFFFESFNQQKFNEAIGENITFVQDNHSKSAKGVLRGLHHQEAPFAQGKLVRVVLGEVCDVAVDIRKDSLTFGQWVSEILSAENKKQLWIPEGFAHGFYVVSHTAEVNYKATNFYNRDSEIVIKYNDPELNIDWPIVGENNLLISDKDINGIALADLQNN